MAAGTEFWKTAGGMNDPSFGITPIWQQAPGAGIFDPITVVLRGGRLFITVANPQADTVNVRIQLFWVKGSMRNTTDSAVSNTVQDWLTAITGAGARPIGWDITQAPDFDQYMYRPVIDKQVSLQQGQDVSVFYKIKPVKIDCASFQRGAHYTPIWGIYCGQSMDIDTAGETLTCTFGHNLTFAVTDLPT